MEKNINIGSSGPCRCRKDYTGRAFFIIQAVFGKWEGWITRTPFWTQNSMERARGITIFSKQAGFRLGEKVLHPSGYAGACGFFSRNGENLAGAGLRSLAYQRRRQVSRACADPLAVAETV